jgi:hypothetical protein
MIRQKLRIMFIDAQKKHTPFGVYFFSIHKNIPQTGYKRKIKYTPNGVYFFCASINMMRNFWQISIENINTHKIII